MKVGLDSLGTRMDAGFPEMVPGAGLEPARLAAGDFESPESTNFTTRAGICEDADYGIFLMPPASVLSKNQNFMPTASVAPRAVVFCLS